ncbi:hypothetical protein F5Y19DRAFT_239428 [Xylariaceae sp. FL1651]|nr:hypothetical protein F5Y19DRAFT_239428 [Xylariaceae sp. FL1651]
MRAGAKIQESDLQHLRELVPRLNCNTRCVLPMFDWGFREPGKAQFVAALDHYQPGTPRSFQEPSCYSCGKIGADVGQKLMQYARCKVCLVLRQGLSKSTLEGAQIQLHRVRKKGSPQCLRGVADYRNDCT